MPSNKPYLLFTHYRCNHDPYIRHKAWDFGMRPVDKYDSATAYCDSEIARLLDTLEARQDYNRTALFVFSDHGELFGDHGLTNHGNSLYEADVRILLMVKIPSVAPRKVSTPVLLTDLAPTIMDLAGLKSSDMTGWSLLTHLLAKKKIPHRPLFLFTDLRRGSIKRDVSGVVSWPFKYIRDQRARVDELYNIKSDPKETQNLVSVNKEKLDKLKTVLDKFDAYLAEK
jgi:arylsulfatase A-like enzyme